jgi:hypothetical protein
MGRKKKHGNYSSPKNNLIQDSEGNEENRYPVPDQKKKTMVNDTKEPSNAHENTLKEEITENFIEKVLDVVNQNVQDALKKF